MSNSKIKLRAVAAVIRKHDLFLGIKRSQSVRAPGKICFPGGGIESGETAEQAVVRELREELSANVKPICEIWQCVTPWAIEVRWFECELLTDDLLADPAEVQWYGWLSAAEFEASPDLLVSNAQFFTALRQGKFKLS